MDKRECPYCGKKLKKDELHGNCPDDRDEKIIKFVKVYNKWMAPFGCWWPVVVLGLVVAGTLVLIFG